MLMLLCEFIIIITMCILICCWSAREKALLPFSSVNKSSLLPSLILHCQRTPRKVYECQPLPAVWFYTVTSQP